MTARASKVVSLDRAASTVKDGQHVAIGGIWNYNTPTALVRALARRELTSLTLSSSPAAGYAVDLMVACGMVATAYLPNVTFEHLGNAPNFRSAIESGSVELVECDESTLIGGYRAAAAGLPFQPVVAIDGSSLAARSDQLVTLGRDNAIECLAAPAITPDVVILHAQEADRFGNVRHRGSVFTDRLLAKSSDTVLVTVDRLVDNTEIRSCPHLTTIPGYLVTMVVETPYGAHPCGSHGRYQPDESHLRQYVEAGESRRRGLSGPFSDYLNKFVSTEDHTEYLQAVGGVAAIEERLGLERAV